MPTGKINVLKKDRDTSNSNAGSGIGNRGSYRTEHFRHHLLHGITTWPILKRILNRMRELSHHLTGHLKALPLRPEDTMAWAE